MEKVVVLGSGPAGLLAAKAVRDAGQEVQIRSVKQRSMIGGAMYLHEAIPGVTNLEPDSTVVYQRTGTREGYATKVYGDPNAPVSWDTYPPGERSIWNMSWGYDTLWRLFDPCIIDQRVSPEVLNDLLESGTEVISSIPRWMLCTKMHLFDRQAVWIAYHRADLPLKNYIHYAGEGSVDYYRRSLLFGWQSAEYAFNPSGLETRKVDKPLKTNCTCWTHFPNFHMVGRYGRWEKKVLAHEAYYETRERLDAVH